MRSWTNIVVLAALLCGFTQDATEIDVMRSGGLAAAYRALAPEFTRETGIVLNTVSGASMGGAPTSIPMRLARGEPADVVIMAGEGLEKLITEGHVVADSRVDVASSLVGMAVRFGAEVPDISSVEAFKRALLEAKSIAYSASASGTYLSTELFPRLGIADALRDKSIRVVGERVGAVVARGEAEIGFQQVSELLPIEGITFVGTIPDEVQKVTMAGRVGEMIEDRERLLGDVSHELRSPLSRMKVALEFMPEGDKRDSLERDIREMEGLVVALLEREELRSRSAPIAATPVDLTALTAEVVETFQGREPGIELISNGAVTVHGDANWLELLVKNLLDNAVKFSRPGASPVEVEIRSDDDAVLLTIRDDGIGVPADDTEKLFEPFVKLAPARGHESGHGLGLNLCQRIVHLHGGTIDIRPREEGGTEVLVRF